MSTIHTSLSRPASRGSSGGSSQRLALDNSILKLRNQRLSESGGQSTKSIVGFKDVEDNSAVKKQKQAWESPPDTPQLSRQSSEQKRIEKVLICLFGWHYTVYCCNCY